MSKSFSNGATKSPYFHQILLIDPKVPFLFSGINRNALKSKIKVEYEEIINNDSIIKDYNEITEVKYKSPSKSFALGNKDILKITQRHPLTYALINLSIPIYENDKSNPANTSNYKRLFDKALNI